jgi:prepilin-type N-terminal cleavage/methylation domain-containing protein
VPFGLTRRPPVADGRALDRGITLVELLVTMSLIGILGAIATWSLHTYSVGQSMKATTNDVLSEFRAVAQRATAEDRTYCVSIDSATQYSLWRYSCNPSEPTTPAAPKLVSTSYVNGNSLLKDVSFTSTSTNLAHTCRPGTLGCVFFYPRGNASGGSITVGRSGTSASRVISVVGLTGRAYQSS